MDEKVESHMRTEERLKQLDEERKSLRIQVKSERVTRLEEAAEMRVERDEKIEKLQIKLKKIQSIIHQYNKLGKVAKIKLDVLESIREESLSEGFVP